MQLTETICFDSAIFIEKKTVENRLWAKSEFLWSKKDMHPSQKVSFSPSACLLCPFRRGFRSKISAR